VAAYDPEAWSELFVASAGASAALAGLVFVAVSINVQSILKFEGLPERALQTVLLLLGVLIVSIVGLIPGQATAAVGVELLVCSLAFAAAIWKGGARSTDPGALGKLAIDRVVLLLLGTVPFVVGSASLLLESGGGLYWIVAGIVFATCGAVASAWVLLVEILR
jgi:hypothetical protein